MSAPEVSISPTPRADSVNVAKRRVSCDGGKGALGHPKVYLEISKHDHVLCPYCGKKFVYTGGGHGGGH